MKRNFFAIMALISIGCLLSSSCSSNSGSKGDSDDADNVTSEVNAEKTATEESQMSQTPPKEVTIDMDTHWLEGVWSDSGFQYVLLFSDGKMCIEHQYSTLNYGKWHVEGNEIILTMVADVDTGLDLSYPIGTELRYTVNPDEGTLGNGSGYEMVKWELKEVVEEGDGGLTISEFQALRKRTDKYVK